MSIKYLMSFAIEKPDQLMMLHERLEMLEKVLNSKALDSVSDGEYRKQLRYAKN
jgi:hypothetical protein